MAALAAERIEAFASDIVVSSDGRFTVTETIVYDFGTASRHGIFRTLPIKHPQAASLWYKERYLDIADVTVTRNGNPAMVEGTVTNTRYKIRIGDPEQTITGTHTYQITYTVSGGLMYYDTDDPELYWNVTGAEWEVPIDAVLTTVRAEPPLLLPQATCYAGPAGTGSSNNDSCTVTQSARATLFTSEDIAPGEEVTVAQSLNPTAVATLVQERVSLASTMIPLVVAGLFGLGMWLYLYRTVHRPRNRTIVTQYEPYQGVLPMYAGFLLDGKLHARDITAGLLYLAQIGFITIKRTEQKMLWLFNVTDYELTLHKDWSTAPTTFHTIILKLLFSNNASGADTNKPLPTITLRDLRKDKKQQRKNYLRLQKLKVVLWSDVEEQGFYEEVIPYRILASIAVVVAGISIWLVLLRFTDWFLIIPIGVGIGLVAYFLTRRRRTRTGYEAMYHLQGFKHFLAMTDTERFKFHNAPKKDPQQFLEYLPYAVAFGVEKEWQEVFRDVTIPQPDWYVGSHMNSFSAAVLTADVSQFSSVFSQSTGTSASSGGGSAGGGAGGGGGGSW